MLQKSQNFKMVKSQEGNMNRATKIRLRHFGMYLIDWVPVVH